MRILLINPNTTGAITDRMGAYVDEVAGTTATFVPVTGRFGARYISSRAAAAIAAHAALEALAEHVDGCDAVYLACFGDPGLAALKEVSPVPVVGMAEAACVEAARGGRRFAIVTGGVLWKPMLTEFVATLGLSRELAAIRTIAPTGDQIASDPEAALSLLADACMACAREDGAEVVILGGAALAGLARRIQPRVTAPLLCSVEVGAKATLAAAESRPRGRREAPALESTGLSLPLAKLIGA
ncbi:aspartate/glutamate racemase family protein [Bradyrhizobium sp. LHD-71]|uniref:aspartate/glutamate racemase family protein n=1 Tax=Bradyrhizobium sp. LHD-71 TaxID=3072141 RepID=UPI00280C59BB|nr:aspartate/glutamate racemase family protein [Bradyrhizobium sp. LHD-71]MDQ8728681.1 aspartate/glutamate racemase family protein [Bradyrhizobium sp. LHD-71]